MTKNKTLFKLTSSAIFAALIFAATYFAIPIPGGQGFVNLGDGIILIAAVWLGPLWGGIAAAVGAGITDLILGYVYYAPATFVIKWLMAVVMYFVFKGLSKTKLHFSFDFILSGVAAELLMVAGYFLYEIFLYSLGVALFDTVANAIQGAFGITVGLILYSTLNKTHFITKLFKE
jgi:uncharacterized membrane protein